MDDARRTRVTSFFPLLLLLRRRFNDNSFFALGLEDDSSDSGCCSGSGLMVDISMFKWSAGSSEPDFGCGRLDFICSAEEKWWW